jgi:hypothetical protein
MVQIDWMIQRFDQDEGVNISNIFKLTKDKVRQDVVLEDDATEVPFVIGKLVNDYWKIDKSVIRVDHEVFINKDYSIKLSTLSRKSGDVLCRTNRLQR